MVYRPVKQFEGLYEISDMGSVRAVPREIIRSNGCKQTFKSRFLKTNIDGNGYVKVSLQRDGKRYTVRIHVLVANAFLPNPKNLPEVNHIDEDKTNNTLLNLERCTSQYNVEYSKAERLNFNKNGETIEIFNLNKFCRDNALDQSCMSRVRNGINKQHKGYYYGRA